MNLNKVKKDIKNIKEVMGKNDKPSVDNFFKWCEINYYHRPVNLGELWFDEYTIIYPNGSSEKVKADMRLFLLLSDKYFRQMHNVDNPFKDGDTQLASWKDRLLTYWFKKYNPSEYMKPYNYDKRFNDPDYTKWFNEKWDIFIETEDLKVFEELFEDS